MGRAVLVERGHLVTIASSIASSLFAYTFYCLCFWSKSATILVCCVVDNQSIFHKYVAVFAELFRRLVTF